MFFPMYFYVIGDRVTYVTRFFFKKNIYFFPFYVVYTVWIVFRKTKVPLKFSHIKT